MNNTNNTNNITNITINNDDIDKWVELAFIIFMGSVIITLLICVCIFCYKNNKEEKNYINWVKSKKLEFV